MSTLDRATLNALGYTDEQIDTFVHAEIHTPSAFTTLETASESSAPGRDYRRELWSSVFTLAFDSGAKSITASGRTADLALAEFDKRFGGNA